MRTFCHPLALVGAALLCSGPIFPPSSAAAQTAQQPSPSDTVTAQPTAPVMVDGIPLFNVRGIAAYPAERRAANISARIAALAANRAIPAESISVREEPTGSSVVAGGRMLFHLVDADAALEGVSRTVLAQVYRARVAEAVARFRHDREAAVLGANAARAVAAVVVLALALWIGSRGLRWLRRTLDRVYRARVRDLEFRNVQIVRAEHLWQGLQRLLSLVATLVALVAVYTCINYVLLLFPWTRGLGRGLASILIGPMVTIGQGAVRYVPNFVFLVILALLTRYLLKFVHIFFRRVAEGRLTLAEFEPDWAPAVERIIRLLVIAFALVIAYPYIPGSESEAFKGITILLGLLFSIGSPSVIGNVVAGQSLAFRRVFRVGDRISIRDHVGVVTQIRLLTTYLRSFKNEQIVIPNALILNSEVVNFTTLADTRGVILHTTVGIGYETPWRQVVAMLLEAAARTQGVLRQPEPFVLLKALGDFAVVYEINVYSDKPLLLGQAYSALHGNVLDVFNEYGVQIMTPAYEGDPERPKVVPRGQWFAAPAKPGDVSRADGHSGSPASV